ncbi:outer membrane beta-barrel protein [Paraflavitalea sp. CAU 1676]|uniref:outer membrane beta-barrel protein n=1 Tax=Paraflavitalea sp. CAU 1676 TaxID=3032598 RepID=UPI0023DAC439|nr:outer membrane beta-barrel protein [Paraflavitalea sp. CAU 1676]MDF2190780.1 outer membrane beta-barrel protein [Paraflavitalea sp. CAU 1676]
MRSIAGLIVFTLILIFQAQAQRDHYASLKGTVIDSASRQPVEAATVSVFLIADSSLVSYAITNKKGEFLLKTIPQARPCRVLVSYSGLHSYAQDFVIAPETKELIINTVQLRKSYAAMEEVIVSAQRPPVMVKKDTLEFNAGSFKTPINGVVEDLLKQLPGVEVDAEGNITVNGKKVTKITVDGKDFFGSDFKITSKNLPRDIIDKIQIVDYRTREAQFNKTTTGNEDKAINLTLKKDKKRGLFGRASSGYGSNERYEAGASLNYYKGPMQLSFIGYANNTNRMSFSGGDFSMSKPVSSFNGGGSGLTKTKAAGLNFSQDISKKLRITGSYFFNNNEIKNLTNARRQNILADSTFFYRSITNSNTENRNHRVNINLEYKPDSLTDLFINSAYNTGQSMVSTGNEAASTSITGEKINSADNAFTNSFNDRQVSLDAFVGRRLNNKGRSVTVAVNYNHGARRLFDTNKGMTVYYGANGANIEDTVDQQAPGNAKSKQMSLSTTWNEPVSRKLDLILGYNYMESHAASNRVTYLFNPQTNAYDLPDSLYSNATSTRFIAHTPNIRMGYRSDKLTAYLGANLQWLQQSNQPEISKPARLQRYSNMLPNANFNYRYSKTGNINFSYSGSSQQPSIEQLQPVPDNTNTLYITLGNPNLKPSFFHNMGLNFQQYNSSTYWNAGVGFNTASNQIVYETWFDSVQYTRPINSNGNYSLSYNLHFSRSWKKKDWSFRIIAGSNGFFNRNVSFTNKALNITRLYHFTQRIGLTYTFKELLTLMPVFMIRYNDTKYSQSQSAENMTKSITANAFLNWPKRLIFENNVQYHYNSRTAPGFPKAVTMWNIAANYQLFKDRQGLLRFSVYDLLKQSTNIYRSTTPTYIEDTQVQVLQQYFLVSFIYTLKQFR